MSCTILGLACCLVLLDLLGWSSKQRWHHRVPFAPGTLNTGASDADASIRSHSEQSWTRSSLVEPLTCVWYSLLFIGNNLIDLVDFWCE